MTFGPDERPRSLQMYGSDPEMLGRAVHHLCDGGLVDHIDINLGCPAAKVTRKGGGAAVAAKPALLRAIVQAAVRAAQPVRRARDRQVPHGPVGRRAELRRAPARSAPRPGWRGSRCTPARSSSTTPARPTGTRSASSSRPCPRSPCSATATSGRPSDAVAMMRRDRLRRRGGRPRLPRPAVAVRRPRRSAVGAARLRRHPRWPSSLEAMARHARLLVDHCTEFDVRDGKRSGEDLAMRDFRKHTSWYLTGYPVGPEVRHRLAQVVDADRARRACSAASTRRPSSSPAASGSSAATPTARSRSPSPTATSTTSTTSTT